MSELEPAEEIDPSHESPYSPRDKALARVAVELSRRMDRAQTHDYVDRLLEDWVELHGDRRMRDDPAIVAGFGRFNGRTICVIGHQKGHDATEAGERNTGMASPEGYVKAVRVMELANKFKFPVVTMVDTEGAWPGREAEQHGQGGAIARCQAAMFRLEVPTIAIILSRGGSGGAVALAVADRVFMQQRAQYGVISPEGGAAILWKNPKSSKRLSLRGRNQGMSEKELMATYSGDMAVASRYDAQSALELGVIDGIIPEPTDGTQSNYDLAAKNVGDAIATALSELDGQTPEMLRAKRRAKFRQMGVYTRDTT